MGCGCQSNKTNNVAVQPQKVTTSTIVESQVCEMTLEILQNWETILTCIKNMGSSQKILMNEIILNQFLGIIQSAKNYPDNYCFYKANLDIFKNKYLPQILENEPSCI